MLHVLLAMLYATQKHKYDILFVVLHSTHEHQCYMFSSWSCMPHRSTNVTCSPRGAAWHTGSQMLHVLVVLHAAQKSQCYMFSWCCMPDRNTNVTCSRGAACHTEAPMLHVQRHSLGGSAKNSSHAEVGRVYI